ncbi:hypothetical protein GCM10023331_19590 [Algivirga pacifica]|uniref:Fluoroquinolone transporter permease n=2 Tax=Algivirga pacifica TaxID=1162670 RepID=A0ABP9D9R2_9BACT
MTLALADFKIIFRDPSLKSFLVLPVLLFALILWGVPALVDNYPFLEPYLPVFLVVAVVENTQMFSFITTMVLIDEKETNVAPIYGVVPLKKWEYLLSRFLIPYLFTALLNIILFEVQPFYTIHWIDGVGLSLLTALIVPVYALSVNAIVKNRMEGMVYIKAFNMLVLLPIAAFFIPEEWRMFFGVLPTHWVFQGVEAVTQGVSIALYMGVGVVFFVGLLWGVAKVFIRKHFV